MQFEVSSWIRSKGCPQYKVSVVLNLRKALSLIRSSGSPAWIRSNGGPGLKEGRFSLPVLWLLINPFANLSEIVKNN